MISSQDVNKDTFQSLTAKEEERNFRLLFSEAVIPAVIQVRICARNSKFHSLPRAAERKLVETSLDSLNILDVLSIAELGFKLRRIPS